MNKEIEAIFVDILKTEMSLPDNYGTTKNGDEIPSIVVGSQNIEFYSTKNLQVVVSNIDSQVMSNTNKNNLDSETDPANFEEIQSVVLRETIQIDLISKNNDARSRRWEVLAALQSIYSLSQQEEYQFKIYRSSLSFVNTTSAEGGSQLNRFTLTVPVTTWHEKRKALTEYYENFPARVDNENTVGTAEGVIEFELE